MKIPLILLLSLFRNNIITYKKDCVNNKLVSWQQEFAPSYKASDAEATEQ